MEKPSVDQPKPETNTVAGPRKLAYTASAHLPSTGTAIEDLTSKKGSLGDKKKAIPREEVAAKHPGSEGKKLLTRDSSEYQVITKASQLEAEVPPTNEHRDSGKAGAEENNEPRPPRGYDYQLVDEKLYNEVEFKCPICELIPREPAKVSCCGLVFCRSCITSHSEVCPDCNDTFEWIIDKLLERKINSLQVYCVNHDGGCEWSGDLSHVEEHTHKVTGEDTGVERCQYELTICEKCDEKMLYGELDHHMDNLCQHRVIRCEFQFVGCNFEGSEASMPKHLQDNTSRHLSLLGEFAKKNKRTELPCQNYCLRILLALATLVFAVHIFRVVPIHTDQEIGTMCKKMVKDELHSESSTYRESISDIEWKLDDLHRKTVANELALQSLQYGLNKDLHQRLIELEATVKDLKTDMLKLAILSQDIDQVDELELSIEQLKIDVADLKSGFTKHIDDAIKAGMSYFFPSRITDFGPTGTNYLPREDDFGSGKTEESTTKTERAKMPKNKAKQQKKNDKKKNDKGPKMKKKASRR